MNNMAVTSPVEKLREKLLNKTAVVGVVGLGYVGLPFAVEKAKIGFSVVGFDYNHNKVSKINAGVNYISDVKDDELLKVVQNGHLRAVDNFLNISEMDVVVICVPTPLNRNLAPDLLYVVTVTKEISKNLRLGQLISLESTTYPGTTEEVMLPILEQSGLIVEKDFFLCHSPERVDPGNKRYTTKNTNKVVGGVGPVSLEVGLAFYSQTIETVVTVSSARAAEMVKVFENTFRAVNIALVNELALLCDRMNLNVWEVLDAAFTKPFGIMPFYPGPGVGGHCIPLDPHYLEWKAREYNFTTRFIGLAGEINRTMPEFVWNKTRRIMNEMGKSLSMALILVIGVAYKKDLDDARESPAIEVCELLLKDHANIIFHDPYIESIETHGHKLISSPLSVDLIKQVDLVLITTDHSIVNYELIVKHAKRVFDTRNATKNISDPEAKVVLL